MRKILKISWITLKSFIILVLLSFTTTAIVENISTEVLINNFVAKGVYQESLSTGKIKYFKIPYEGLPTMYYDSISHDCYPGGKGDILVSPEQTTIAPILNEFISFYAGGHAAYSVGEFGDSNVYVSDYQTIETSLTQSINTADIYNKTDWIDDRYFNRIIGLRVDMTKEEYEMVTSVIMSYYGDYYNASFLFNTEEKKYCSDLISQGFKYINKDLNRDTFTTSIYDLIVSPDTYISYYHYIDNGIKYVYYLG